MDVYRAGPRGPPEEFGGEKGGAPTGCFLRYSDTSFFTRNNITDITPYVQGGISSSKSTIIVYIVGALLLFLLILALFLWYRLYRKKAERDNAGHKKWIVYSGNFCTYNLNVVLLIGDVAAVKKLSMTTSKAKADFETEIRLISNTHHGNIILLLGCSGEESELLLVFEDMANGSLDNFLYGMLLSTIY
ncbi:cysteine-rich receptor-like protein kinase 42 [Apium graveolens]|uniref:cysteine-rich receptor-like protein kinase 42 n=1 Tax=Apium graveolens TaxID=4045 RepID=UPI003D7B9794